MSQIGDRLKSVRAHLSQQDIADALGVGLSTYRRYEAGERVPDADFLAKLREAKDVDLNWLLTGRTAPAAVDPASFDSVLMRKIIRDLMLRFQAREKVPSPTLFAGLCITAYEMIQSGEGSADSVIALISESISSG